eukprot:TRINITY_DN10432_c0_g1_i1.p1 TRINITY_DN10432_c0_g1~~TRINITY_DN10432_c0_g1_i1.p1  ORF type:complete len:136 (-),score=22.22 TRINITY_DN10432_c0_g1_i1:119-493(-)
MNIVLRILRFGLGAGVTALGGYLTKSPAFHRLVHSTNRMIFGLVKKVSENPNVAQQTERLKQTMQNQSAFVKDKANSAPKEAPKAPKAPTPRYAPGEQADWFTRTYQTYKYQYNVWKQSRKSKE